MRQRTEMVRVERRHKGRVWTVHYECRECGAILRREDRYCRGCGGELWGRTH